MRIALLLMSLLHVAPATATDFPRFRAVEVDTHAGEICYAVCVTDVDGDKKPDIVVATEDAVLWYANPSWEKHVIIKGATARDNVCIQPHDIDGDGRIDFALGAGWKPPDTTNPGTLQWLGRDAKGTWQVHPISFNEPSIHRLRWGDVLGNGKAQLVVAPLQGRGTKGPNWGDGPGVQIQVFSIPDDPNSPTWPVEVASDTLHTVHNLHIADEYRPGEQDDVFVAAREGVFLLRRLAPGNWLTTSYAPAPGAEAAFRGAGEVRRGLLNRGKLRYIAAVEPFHGDQVVAYVSQGNGKGYLRQVVDEPVTWAHALWCADLDGDGNEDLIVGQRDPNPNGGKIPVGPGIWAYGATLGALKNGVPATAFARHDIDDGGIAVEDLVAADLDADGRPEIVAVGRATHNVKIYWNQGKNARP